MNRYVHIKIKNWKEFCEKVAKYKEDTKGKWIFRGHISGKPLLSSLDRAVQYYPDYPERLRKGRGAEKALLREFKRRYHQYSSDVPKDDDYLEWLSIMQHYGAPTRLVDFTYSPYVAAYFALEHTDRTNEKNDKKTFEVFAINAIWAIDASANINKCRKGKNFFRKLIDNKDKDRKNFKHPSSIRKCNA